MNAAKPAGPRARVAIGAMGLCHRIHYNPRVATRQLRRTARGNGRTARRPTPRRNPVHSVTFTPELVRQIERYAKAHNVRFGAAVRALVTDQLRELGRIEQLRRAREWQIAQAWSEVEAMERGESPQVSWDEVEAVIREARARMQRKARRAAG